MKKPFVYSLEAALYIVLGVLVMNALIPTLPQKSLFIPMLMSSLFVLSAAVMGFLFLSEPFQLYMENRKQEAVTFFAKIVGFFACFVAVFLVLLLIL